nr:Hpt domain-containing protein [Actinomycetota bacterium]
MPRSRHGRVPDEADQTTELVGALERASTIAIESPTGIRAGDGQGPAAGAIDADVLPRLVESMGGDPGFVAELLDEFAVDAPKMLDEARRGLASHDNDVVRHAAHTLKSNASTFGALGLSSLCAQLEVVAKDGDLAHAPELLGRIEAEHVLVVDELRAARAQLVTS